MSDKKRSSEAFNTPVGVALFPKAVEQGMSGKYECMVAWPKDSDAAKAILAKYKEAEAEHYPEGKPSNWAHPPLRNGDEKTYTNPDTGVVEVRKGFEGCMYVTAKSERKPFLVAPSGREPLEDPSMLQHGSHVVVNMNFYSWEHSGKCGLTLGLNSIQVSSVKDDLPGGGFQDPLATFSDMGVDSSVGAGVSEDELEDMFG
jgi:hypothetical protein